MDQDQQRLNAPSFMAIHPIVVHTFHSKHICQPHGGAGGRVSRNHPLGAIKTQHFMEIHPTVVEIFQSGG